MYADNMMLVLRSKREWYYTKRILWWYSKASGTKINLEKTKILAVNPEGPDDLDFQDSVNAPTQICFSNHGIGAP